MKFTYIIVLIITPFINDPIKAALVYDAEVVAVHQYIMVLVHMVGIPAEV